MLLTQKQTTPELAMKMISIIYMINGWLNLVNVKGVNGCYKYHNVYGLIRNRVKIKNPPEENLKVNKQAKGSGINERWVKRSGFMPNHLTS